MTAELPPSPMAEPEAERLHLQAALPLWAPLLVAGAVAVCAGAFWTLGVRYCAYAWVPWPTPPGGGLFRVFGLVGGFWEAMLATLGMVLSDRLLSRWSRPVRWALGMAAAALAPGPEFVILSGCHCGTGTFCSPLVWVLLTPAGSALAGAVVGLLISAGRSARWSVPVGAASVGTAWALADGLLGGPAASVLAPGCNTLVLGDWLFLLFAGWATGAVFGAAVAAASRFALEPPVEGG